MMQIFSHWCLSLVLLLSMLHIHCTDIVVAFDRDHYQTPPGSTFDQYNVNGDMFVLCTTSCTERDQLNLRATCTSFIRTYVLVMGSGLHNFSLKTELDGSFTNKHSQMIQQLLSYGTLQEIKCRLAFKPTLSRYTENDHNPKKGLESFFHAATHLPSLNLEITALVGRNHSIACICGLADFLKKTTSLTNLELWQNGIDDSGAYVLAGALENNSSLKTLDLDFNQISDSGAFTLSAALKNNTTLTRLSLLNNRLYNYGLKVDQRIVFKES